MPDNERPSIMLSPEDAGVMNLSPEELGIVGSGIEITKMPVPQPEGLKGGPSRFREMLANVPSSLMNAITHPTFPGMPIGQPSQNEGEPLGPTPEKLGREIGNFAKPFIHPLESMTEDPVGTSLGAAQILHGGQGKPQKVAMEAAKGAVKTGTEITPYRVFGHDFRLPAFMAGAAGGELASYPLHGAVPHAATAGAAIGASAPFIRGAYQAGKKAIKDVYHPVEGPSTKWMEGPVAPLGESDVPVGPLPKPSLPSGRKVPITGTETPQVEPLTGKATPGNQRATALQSAPKEATSEGTKPQEAPKEKSVYERLAEEGIKKRALDAENKYNDIYNELIKGKMTPDEVRELASSPEKLAMMDYKIKSLRHPEGHPKVGKKKYGGGMNPGMIEELAKRLEKESNP